jgi:acetoin utilization protein AcuB
MTENPHTLPVTGTVREASDLLAELDVRHLPIMEGSSLVGILSDRDLRETLGIDDPDERQSRLDQQVTTVMSADVISVDPEAELSEVIDLMIEQKLGAIPVVDEGTVVGVVSYIDILREARSSL